MTIGVAVLFPMLVVIVMVLQLVADSSRIEQFLQATANRTARTAALCCYRAGGPQGAQEVAEASIRAAERDNAHNRVLCNNDLVADSVIVFEDLGGVIVFDSGDPNADGRRPVPPGGLVHVYLSCAVPPRILGGFALPVFDLERTVVGAAVIDPHRSRAGA